MGRKKLPLERLKWSSGEHITLSGFLIVQTDVMENIGYKNSAANIQYKNRQGPAMLCHL